MEHIWNNANHLITTHNKISKTEQGNLNFIFTEETELRTFSDYYYSTVPAIMSYAVDLIGEMFEIFASLNRYTILMNQLNRILRLLQMPEEISFETAKAIYGDFSLPILCPRCGLKMKMTDKRMFEFLAGKCICSRCRNLIKTSKYIFDWEQIDFILRTKKCS